VYLAALAAAVTLSALVATQNYFTLHDRGRPLAWTTLFVLELPVWLVWLAFSPLIVWLGRRLPVHGPHRWRNLLLHLPLAAVMVLLGSLVLGVVKFPMIAGAPLPFTHAWLPALLGDYRRKFAMIVPIYYLIVGASQVADLYGEAQRRAVREERLQTMLERARGDLLRMQLQPHFLFNTLHAVSALMERDVPAARRMITRLSDLLRLSLDDDSRHEVSLEEEIEFLDRYAEIQKIRFGGRLSVDYDLAPDTRRLLVPRLILQPLVENSITHGLSRLERPGRVRVESRSEDGMLVIRVLDDGAGLRGGGVGREGVGIGNTRARLEQLYGHEQRFTISDRPDGGCEVRIELPAGTRERTPADFSANGAGR
jgi:signal transduction histidine kinase